MRVYLLFLSVGIIYAITLPANIYKLKVDDDSTYIRPSSRVTQPTTAIDSSANASTLSGQCHECISYNPIVDAIQIVNKAFSDVGILNVHQAPGDLSYWVHDDSVYNKEFGAARYPHSIASGDGTGNGPHISFSYYIYWQGMGCQYESGGWFSSFWDAPVDVGTGNLGTHKNIGKQLPNGNILFIGIDVNDNIHWSTYTPDLQTRLAGGIVAPATAYYWGFDINGGIAYLFYYDANLNVYYKTTTDGITWSAQQTYNLVWPNPYLQNIIFWTQMAVTDAGNPLLVFDVTDGDDHTYPYYGKVYVSYASGQSCVEVSSAFGAPDTECFYPTIATGGNKAAVLYCMPRNNEPDSLNWWDFYVVWSTDNGQTWGTPVNYTQSLTYRPGLQQIAKRIDTLRNRVYYVYAVDMIRNIDPFWSNLDPMYICFDYAPYVGVEEGEGSKVEGAGLRFEVLPNVVKTNAKIQYSIPNKQTIRLSLYNIVGRKIASIAEGVFGPGVYTVNHDFSELSSGIYFLVLEGEKETRTQKILIIR